MVPQYDIRVGRLSGNWQIEARMILPCGQVRTAFIRSYVSIETANAAIEETITAFERRGFKPR